MIFHKVLDQIFTSSTQIAVIRVLRNRKTGISGREIGRLAGISPKASLSTLTQLENLKLVQRIVGGRDHIFTLNINHHLVKNGLLPLLEAESNYLIDVKNLIKKKSGRKCISIILFGSVARKEEGLSSDLDVCFVLENKKIQKEVETVVSELSDIISERFGAALAPIYFTLYEFRNKLKKGLPPVNKIISDGVLISGKSLKFLEHGTKK